MGTQSPISEEVLLELQTLLHERRYQVFARRIDETIRKYGPAVSLCLLMVEHARLTDNPAALRQGLMLWSSSEPSDPEPLLQLACLLTDQGAPAWALEALDLAEQTGNRTLEIRLRKARLALRIHCFDGAARAATAGLELAGQGSAEAVFLQGMLTLAGNLQVAADRAELRGLVESAASRGARLQADVNGVCLNCNGAAQRLRRPDRKPSLVDELTSQIRSRHCGCVLGSADLLDLVGPAARVHDGSFWGSRSRVYVVECNEDMLALALATFDVRSVLTDEAVTWIWGPTALEQLERYLLERDEESPQSITVSSNPQVAPIVEKAGQVFHQKVEAWFGEASTYYANLPREHWGDVLGDSPSRPPRILLITTEFSSFLKYSIRDLASAFERMGWQVQVAKESQPTQRMIGVTVPKAVATFRPDLIWQINYMRNAWKGVVPQGVPFVCWDQDHMLHMTAPEQARAVGRFDFVAYLGSGLNHIRRYGYPREQMIPLSMCVNASLFQPDPAAVVDGDVCYVSHHGSPIEQRIRQALNMVPVDRREIIRLILEDYAVRLGSSSVAGIPLAADDCRALLAAALNRQSQGLDDKNLRVLSDRTYRLIANSIWRQHAVRMVAGCDVRLRLYGIGWAENPEFSRFAAGIVEHGRPLVDALRSSRVALQAVVTGNEHQRLWEAAACGSIVLMRYHPGDEVSWHVRSWLERLEKRLGEHIDEVITKSDRQTAARQAAYKFIRVSMMGEDGILTETTLACAQQAASFACVQDQLGDAYEDLAFTDQDDLRGKLGRILQDEAHRGRLRERLLEAAHNHRYDVQLPRVVRRIRERLMQ